MARKRSPRGAKPQTIVTAGRVYWTSYGGRPITIYVRRNLAGDPGVYAIGIAFDHDRRGPAILRRKRRFAERVDSREVPQAMRRLLAAELDKIAPLPAPKARPARAPAKAPIREKKKRTRPPKDTAAELTKAQAALDELFREDVDTAGLGPDELAELEEDWHRRHKAAESRVRRAERDHMARKSNPSVMSSAREIERARGLTKAEKIDLLEGGIARFRRWADTGHNVDNNRKAIADNEAAIARLKGRKKKMAPKRKKRAKNPAGGLEWRPFHRSGLQELIKLSKAGPLRYRFEDQEWTEEVTKHPRRQEFTIRQKYDTGSESVSVFRVRTIGGRVKISIVKNDGWGLINLPTPIIGGVGKRVRNPAKKRKARKRNPCHKGKKRRANPAFVRGDLVRLEGEGGRGKRSVWRIEGFSRRKRQWQLQRWNAANQKFNQTLHFAPTAKLSPATAADLSRVKLGDRELAKYRVRLVKK